jgi:hypothetical protein
MLPLPGFHAARREFLLALYCLAALACVHRTAAAQVGADSLFRSTRGLPVVAAPGPQYDAIAIVDGGGGAFVAWVDERGGDTDVYVKRIGLDGRPAQGWPAQGVAACRAERDQHAPRLAADGAGGVFVVWEDLRGSAPGVFLQHLLPDGRHDALWPSDGMPVCSADYPQFTPDVVADGAGGVIVAWEDRRSGTPAIYVQRIAGDASVEAGWPTNGLVVTPASGGQFLPVLVADDVNGAMVFWEDTRTGASAVLAQRITWRGQRADSWPIGGLVLNPSIGRQDLVCAIRDGAGGAFVGWRDLRRGSPDLYLMRIRGDADPAPGWGQSGVTLSAFPSEKSGLRLAADGTGGVIAAWEEARAGGGTTVYGQRVDGTGRRVAVWPNDGRAFSTASGFQVASSIVADGAGGVYAVWQDFREGQSHVYGQYLGVGGTPAAGWPADGLRLASDASGQLAPATTSDGAGGVIVVWEQGLAEGDLYASRVGPEGLGAQVVNVASTEVSRERIVVRWRAQAGASFELVAQRRREDTEWADLGSRVPSAEGEIVLEDRDIAPGVRFGYRLARPTPNGRAYLGEVWVTTEEAPVLALAGMVPNPARAELTVAFSLPAAGPGTLELIDVAGRRMRWRDLADLGAGRHVVTLDRGNPVPPGFYLVRLLHGDRILTTRGTVIR